MEITAKAKYIKLSPRKTRLVADVIRGLDVVQAKNKLALINKKASKPVAKILLSALANAAHNHNLEESNLYIQTIRVDGGPILYRWMPKAFGRATPIRRRTCHISLVLAERIPSEQTKAKKTKKVKADRVAEKVSTLEPEKIETDRKDHSSKEAEAAKKENAAKKKAGKFHAEPDRPVDRSGGKKQKGFLKKVFQRKSGS